jgi:hypothetical protein
MGGLVKKVGCEVGGGRTCCRNVEKFLCLFGLRIRSFLTHGFVSLGPGKRSSSAEPFFSPSLALPQNDDDKFGVCNNNREQEQPRDSGFFTFKMSPQRNGTSLRSSWKENKYMTRVWVVGGGVVTVVFRSA